MVEEFIARKGLVPNLTSRMSEEKRNTLKAKYINIKKGTIVVTLSALTIPEAKLFIIDLTTSKLKLYGYKTLFAVALGPLVQTFCIPIYIFSKARKLKVLAITLSNLGSKISTGEMSVMNWMWFLTDLAIFGEGVPILNSTDLMLLKNETRVLDEFVGYLE